MAPQSQHKFTSSNHNHNSIDYRNATNRDPCFITKILPAHFRHRKLDPHTIQSQPLYPPMVHLHATMAGLSQVPLFVQQPPIFNQLVQQTPSSIHALSQPQVTSMQTSTIQGSDSYGSGVQLLVTSEFNPLMETAQPFSRTHNSTHEQAHT